MRRRPASDDEILAGLARHLAKVDGLLKDPPTRPAPGAKPARPAVRGLVALGALLPLCVVAVLIAALVLGRGGHDSGCDAACQAGPSMTIVYQLVAPSGGQITDADLEATAAVITARGVSVGQDMGLAVQVATSPPDGLVVTLRVRGGSDRDFGRAAATLDRPGVLSFVLLPPEVYGHVEMDTGTVVAGTTARPGTGAAIDPGLPAQFSWADLDRAVTRASNDASAGWVVEFTMRRDVAASFDAWTGQHVGDFYAVVMDGTVIEAPWIHAASAGGTGRIGLGIGGGLGEDSAHDMATVIRSGPLPVSLQLVSYTVGPTPSDG